MRNTTVKVDHAALKDYLEDWHGNGRGNRCTADGQDWPCKTFREVYFAVHGKYPLTPPGR